MFEFLRLMWLGTIESMRLNPLAFRAAIEGTGPTGVVVAIAILGGASLLLGQSVILFVNRVSPGRFVLSLLMNGVIFALSLAVWAFAIWLTGRVLFPNDIPFLTVFRLVGLGAAPYVFGFLVLLPYAGNFIGRVLSVWSFLVVLAGLTVLAGGNFWAALVCTAIGWLLITVMSATIGRPIIAARNKAWQKVVGSDMNANVQDMLQKFASEERPTTKGDSR